MSDDMATSLTHDQAIDALCGCAATVTVLSYQEAIEGYFSLRGISVDQVDRLASALANLPHTTEHRPDRKEAVPRPCRDKTCPAPEEGCRDCRPAEFVTHPSTKGAEGHE